jgi:hypothetical protein
MKEQFPARTVLRASQALHLYASAGMAIVVAHGTARISGAATWLGEQLVQHHVILLEGEAHVVPSTGWVVVAASNDTEIYCIAEDKREISLLERLRALLTFRSLVRQS